MLRCNDPTCACQPAPPKPNRQIQLTLQESGSSSNPIAIHHADADLDIAFDIINKRVILQETIYRVLPGTPSTTSGGVGGGGGGGGKEINTSRTPLPKRPISWTFTMNFPISTTNNTKNNNKSSSRLHFQNLTGLTDNSLLLTLTLQMAPSGETGSRAGGEKGAPAKIHTKHRIHKFNAMLEKSHLQETLYIPLLRAQQQHQHEQKEEKDKKTEKEKEKMKKLQMQIFLPAERLHSWRTVALIVRTFRRVSAEQWCQLVHLKSVPCRPPGVAGLDWRGLERFVASSSFSSSSFSSSFSSSSGDLGREGVEDGDGDGDGDGVTMGNGRKKQGTKMAMKKKDTGKRKKKKKKKLMMVEEKKKKEPLPEDVDDPVIGIDDYLIFRELYTW